MLDPDQLQQWECRRNSDGRVIVRFLHHPHWQTFYQWPPDQTPVGPVTWYARNTGKKRWLRQHTVTYIKEEQ